MVERSAIKSLNLNVTREKQTLRSRATTLVALFEIHCMSLFFDVEKRRQYREVMADLLGNTLDLFIRELLGCIGIAISR